MKDVPHSRRPHPTMPQCHNAGRSSSLQWHATCSENNIIMYTHTHTQAQSTIVAWKQQCVCILMLVLVTRLHLLHLVVYLALNLHSGRYSLAILQRECCISIYRVCSATSRIYHLLTSFVLGGHLATFSMAFVVALQVIRSYAFEVEHSIVDYICICICISMKPLRYRNNGVVSCRVPYDSQVQLIGLTRSPQ